MTIRYINAVNVDDDTDPLAFAKSKPNTEITLPEEINKCLAEDGPATALDIRLVVPLGEPSPPEEFVL